MSLPEPVPAQYFDMATAIVKTQANGLLEVPLGLFPIRCDGTVIMNPGITVRGASRTGSVIQWDAGLAANNQAVLFGRGDNITVENLTLNATGLDTDQKQRRCLEIQGRNARVINVTGINPSGQKALGNESWAFFLVTDETQPTSIVQDCLVTNVRGDYVEAFAFGGTGCAGSFVRCRAEFPHLTEINGPIFNGFQAAGSARIIDCTQDGGLGLFRTDTNSSKYLRISGCLGTNLIQGVWVVVQNGQTCDGFSVDACTFELLPNIIGNRYGVAISGSGAIRNVRVRGSRFMFAGDIDADIVGSRFAYVIDAGINTSFLNNEIDPAFIDGSGAIGTVVAVREPQAPIP